MIMAKNILDFRSDERLKKIPFFKYHPNPFLTEAFQELSEPEKCECCGKDTLIKYTGGIYAVEEVDCLCPECISDGSAAERFDGEFQDGYSVDKIIDPDGSKIDELIHKTPVTEESSRNAGERTAMIFVPFWDTWERRNFVNLESIMPPSITTDGQRNKKKIC